MSETASSSSRSARSAAPVVISKSLKPLDSGASKDTGSTVSPISSQSRESQRDTTQAASGVGAAYSDRGVPAGVMPQSDFEVLKVQESEGDFARHVRGTSTPIDVTVNQSHSSDEEATEGSLFGAMASEEILVRRESAGATSGGEVAGSMPKYLPEEGVAQRGSLRREHAIESEENKEGGGPRLCETS